MAESISYIQHLDARAGAPTSGLIPTMSTVTSSSAAVRASTTARLVSSSTKAVASTTIKVSSVVVSSKTTSSSPVRAVTSSTISTVQAPSTTATLAAVKTTSSSSSPILSSASSTRVSSTTPLTTSTSTSTSSRISSTTTLSSTTHSSSSSMASSSLASSSLASSASSTTNILASSTASAASKQTSGISGGAIAGIVIGILIVGLAGGIFLFRMIQRRRRANRRMTGGLQAWTDRTSYFSSSGGYGAGVASTREREVEAGQVPFRETEDKNQDGGPWALGEKPMYQEPMLAGTAGVGAGGAYGQQSPQAYQPEYQQPQQHAYQPYSEEQHSYGATLAPQTPTHQTQPQGYPYTPSMGTGTPNTFGTALSPVDAATVIPAQESASGSPIQDGMTVVVRQGFVRTLEDELVIAPGDNLTVVQAYDDGWCLCQSVHNEQGVVPQSCLEPVSAYAQGRTSPIQMPTPAVVVSDEKDEVLASEPDKKLPSLPRSETTKSLAVSERSERRSSLFLNAAAAGLYLQQQNAGQAS